MKGLLRIAMVFVAGGCNTILGIGPPGASRGDAGVGLDADADGDASMEGVDAGSGCGDPAGIDACGVCGGDGSSCQFDSPPVPVASGLLGIDALAADTQYVYYSMGDRTGLHKVSRTEGATSELIVPGVTGARGTPDDVLFMKYSGACDEDSYIAAIDKETAEERSIFDGASAVALDYEPVENTITWFKYCGGHEVHQIDLDTDEVSPIFGGYECSSMAVDADWVYCFAWREGELRKFSAAGGNVLLETYPENSVQTIEAPPGADVLVMPKSGDRIDRVGKETGDVTEIEIGVKTSVGMQVKGSYVYFGLSSGRLGRMLHAGGDVEEIPATDDVSIFAFDGGGLVFVTSAGDLKAFP